MAVDFAWALQIAARYNVGASISYSTVGGFETKLDVYRPFEIGPPKPTLMFMHGGGWAESSTKETWSLWFLPFLQLGWVVVNVDYRPSSVAAAPAAVEDCLQALRWVGRNADEYQIDIQQLVIAGLSSGAHLALTTAMIPLSEPPLRPKWLGEAADYPKPAAVINWCGVSDIADLLEWPNRQEIAIQWLGDGADRGAMAEAVSPLTYVRAGLPPVITLHGDQDDVVPYSHALRLHDALSKAGVASELITLPGARHASLDAYLNAYPQVFDFLARVGLKVHPEQAAGRKVTILSRSV